MTKSGKTIRVSLENYEHIIEQKAELEATSKKNKTPNDVITYLFANQRRRKRRGEIE